MSQTITASIITIGDELLIGQTIDTNSAWMAQQLNRNGIWLRRRVAVGDVREEIWQALDAELETSDIVLLTGGLGPTADDITKPLLADYFGGKMVVHEGALQNVKHIFETLLKRPLLERNLKQAEVPDCCEVLLNKRGTAPGMWFEPKGTRRRVVVSLPGVPFEMKGMMTESVLPRLRSLYALPAIVHRTLLTAGAGESFIAERIEPWSQLLPPHVKLAYLPNYGMVRLRLSAVGAEQKKLEQEIDFLFAELQQSVSDILVINEDINLEQAVGTLLLQQGGTLATAESCSGGYIAHLVTSHAGASDWFTGTVVAYSYDAKEQLLGVPRTILQQEGAVSEATVLAMLKGLLQRTGATHGIATSGIMGPGGGTSDKPVGTVWIAVGSQTAQVTHQFHFRFDRIRNIQLTAAQALLMLHRFLRQPAE